MTDEQVAVIKIVLSRRDSKERPFYADTFVGPDEEHFQRDGHGGTSVEEAVENAARWAASMVSKGIEDSA